VSAVSVAELMACAPVASAGVTSGKHGDVPAGIPADVSSLPLRPRSVMPLTLRELLSSVERATGPTISLAHGDGGTLITGATSASGSVRPGDLFAALPGAHGHGAAYLPQALARGAAAVLTDTVGAGSPDSGRMPVVLADEPRAAVGPLADAIYGRPSAALSVAGITGTSGKTTTSFLVRAGLAALGRTAGAIGTVGTFLGADELHSTLTTPEAADLHALLAVLRERGADSVAMEVSSHALELSRVEGVRFAVAAFTNLSNDHLDFHGDMEHYFAAKARLFDGRATRQVVCIDDEWGRRLVRPGVVTVSTDPSAGADWTASDVRVGRDGATAFDVKWPGGSFAAGCRIPGAYNIANAVVALAVIDCLGADAQAAAPGIALAQVPGRMERIEQGQDFLAIVDYSHKPAALDGALRALRALTRGRLILVLGCGGDRDTAKRPMMGEVAARGADVLIVTDDNPRSESPEAIRAEVLAGALAVPAANRARVSESGRRRQAIHDALSHAQPGDTVLIAGKGHETGQEVAGVVHPFDDRQVMRAGLAALGFHAGEADR
jgi:UDP-N-acetylmuramoyl-L-alanyl-D-glutamate--2,6-diaminopimelate ligase